MPRTLPARALLSAALLIGLAFRVSTVFTDDGIYWPDELYQSFEPAHKAVFGYGLIPWEFVQGARTWVMPAIVAVVLKLCAVSGLDSPSTYLHAVKLLFVAVSMATVLGVYRLAMVLLAHHPRRLPVHPERRRGADASVAQSVSGRHSEVDSQSLGGAQDELMAAAAASVWALCALSLYFAPRAMSENAAAAAIVWGLALVLDEQHATTRLLVTGASLLGLSVLFRLQSAVFCVGAVCLLAVQARRAHATLVFGVLVAWALGYGLLDAITWHDAPGAKALGFFHSVVVYVRFNLIEGQGARWGTAPWQYYAKHLWSAMPAVTLVLLVGAVLSVRRALGVVLTCFAFVAIHALVAHKELRFMVPVLPVVCALVAVGLAEIDALKIPALQFVAPAVAAVAAASAYTAPSLTMGDLGAYETRPQSSAWDDFGNVNRLMIEAGKHPDLCGLRIDVVHLAWTGGSTHVHKRVPLYMPGYPVTTNHFNYAIVGPGSGAEVVARDKGLELVRLPQVSCQTDTQYSWLLP